VLPTLKPTETAVPPPDLVAMTTDRLKGELANMLTSTAARLVRLAWVVRILEERGEDLSDLGLNLIPYLRRIAYGQMSAEAVVRFSGSPALMEAISMLPRPDQERIASGANVELVVRRGDKEFDTRQCDPARLTRSQFRQIFAKGRVRDRAERVLGQPDLRARRGRRGGAGGPRGARRGGRGRAGDAARREGLGGRAHVGRDRVVPGPGVDVGPRAAGPRRLRPLRPLLTRPSGAYRIGANGPGV
jgi:hypothetical protein